jgi:hypothetical protein
MALRVARGLLRLWLVLSVLWIGGVAAVTWWTLPVDICVTPPGGPHFCDENDVVGTGPNFDPPTNHPLSQVPQFDPSKPYRLPHDAERTMLAPSAARARFERTVSSSSPPGIRASKPARPLAVRTKPIFS